MKTLGIIGFGQFGQFMEQHLRAHFNVCVYDPKYSKDDASCWESLENMCDSDIVVFAVPFASLEEACTQAKPHIKKETLLADVTSVKVKPLELLQEHFPENQILGTHPIFGPRSGEGGIEGLPLAITNISWDEESFTSAKSFLQDTLQLKVVEVGAEEHDEQMAYEMGLAHFIGRALKHIGIEKFETNTKSYKELVNLQELLRDDSWELFETIQNDNPYAKHVREELLHHLHDLERRLNEARNNPQ